MTTMQDLRPRHFSWRTILGRLEKRFDLLPANRSAAFGVAPSFWKVQLSLLHDRRSWEQEPYSNYKL